MVVVRGVNVFPSEIEQVVLDAEDLSPTSLIVLDTTGPLSEMTVALELASAGREGDDDRSHRQERARELSGRLTERLGIHARVVVGRPGALPRTELGKAVRLVRVASEGDGRPPEIVALMKEG
jgi:phenylacetate-CoA ligase